MRLGISYPLLENLLRLLDELPMQIDRVGRHAPLGVILAEDKLGCALVVLVHFAAVRFALFGEFFGEGTVAV